MKETMIYPAAAVPARAGGWLVLCYVLPARCAHARVQAWRRLQRLGAIALRHSASSALLPLPAGAQSNFTRAVEASNGSLKRARDR